MRRFRFTKLLNVARLYVGWLYVGLLFALVACQPVTLQTETPTLIEHKIPTHNAHANGIKVGADGALWFAESGANQIGRITADGVITEYAIPTEDALDDRQAFVALGPDGTIWFNEDLVNKLGRIALDGTITEYDLPEGTGGIREMVAGPDGNLWVTATFVNKILKLNTEAEVLAEYTMPGADSRPVGMVLGPDGAFWFVENGANQIGRITVDGEITEYAIPTANSVPLRITVGPDNALWFTMAGANKIGRISLDGEITEFDAPDMQPVGIATGADGAIWFTGYRSTEIGRLTVDGVLTKIALPTYAAVPYHIVAGPDGNIWFTEQQSNLIGQIILPAAIVKDQPASVPTTFSPKMVKVPMNFSFDADWHIDDNLPGMVTITNKQDFSLSFYIVTDGQLADPIDGHLIAFPDDFLSWIKSNPDFDAVKSTPVTIAGIEGVQIDATPIWKSTTTYLKPLLSLSGPGWANGENIVNDPEQWRFILLDDVNGERLLIILIDERGHNFKGAVEQAQKVLDTVVFSKPTTFSSENFELPMSVSFGSDGYVTDDFTDLVTIASMSKDWELGFNIVTNAIVANPLDGNQIAFPEDFVSWIKSNPDFKTDEPTEVMVAGIKGVQIDAIPMGTKKSSFLYMSGTTWNTIPTPEGWRFILLDDVNGEQLLIVLIAPADQFQGAVEQAQEVLDTVVFSKP